MPRTFEDWLRSNKSDLELFRSELILGIKANFSSQELREIALLAPFKLKVANFPSRARLSQAMLACLPAPTPAAAPAKATQPQPTTAATQAMIVASAFQKLVDEDPEAISANMLVLNRVDHILDRLYNIEQRLNKLHVPDTKDVKQLERLMRRMNEDYAVWDAAKVESILRAASDNPGHMQALRDMFQKLDECVPIIQ